MGTGFVDYVNRLVRQVAIGDVAFRQLSRHTQCLIGVLQVMVLLEMGLQPLEDLVGILNAGFVHINLLEAASQRAVLLENATEFLEGGGANAPDFP